MSDRCVLIALLVIVLGFFFFGCHSFLLLFSFLVIWWLSLVLIFGFLSVCVCVCVCIIRFWCMITMRFLYSRLYIFLIILSCWSLKVGTHFTTLCYPPTFNVFDILMFCISFCFVYPLITYCGYGSFIRGVWRATFHGITKIWTQLSN